MMTSRNEENLRTLAMLRYQADRYHEKWYNESASKC